MDLSYVRPEYVLVADDQGDKGSEAGGICVERAIVARFVF